MNRAVPPDPKGRGIGLQPGYLYRLLVLVNGETSCEDLQANLVAAGFDPARITLSDPFEWQAQRPRDWPDEPIDLNIAANECLVRVSGLFIGRPMMFGRDLALGPGASYTILAAWQYVQSIGERAGAAAAAARTSPASSAAAAPAPAKRDSRGTAALIGGVALLGLGLWSSMRSSKRIERETARLHDAAERARRASREQEIARAVEQGSTREQAESEVDEGEIFMLMPEAEPDGLSAL